MSTEIERHFETPQQAPSVGRIVHVTLNETMADQINRRRTDSRSIFERIKVLAWPQGAQAHIGNPVKALEVYPMIITRVWGRTCVNGQVLLDGNDTYWATSLLYDDNGGPSSWYWPPRT